MIRVARPTDLEEVVYVERICFEEANVRLLQKLCGVSDTFLVYDSGRGVRGYVLSTLHRGLKARVASLAVLPSDRRRGLGRRLLDEVLSRLRDRDVSSVVLEVRPSNEPAQNLYRDLGFELVGVKPGYYSDGEDAYVMELEL